MRVILPDLSFYSIATLLEPVTWNGFVVSEERPNPEHDLSDEKQVLFLKWK